MEFRRGVGWDKYPLTPNKYATDEAAGTFAIFGILETWNRGGNENTRISAIVFLWKSVDKM